MTLIPVYGPLVANLLLLSNSKIGNYFSILAFHKCKSSKSNVDSQTSHH